MGNSDETEQVFKAEKLHKHCIHYKDERIPIYVKLQLRFQRSASEYTPAFSFTVWAC